MLYNLRFLKIVGIVVVLPRSIICTESVSYCFSILDLHFIYSMKLFGYLWVLEITVQVFRNC